MQTPKKNTSQIIKQTLEAKKKSRQRLIGSIFLLFIALIVLLKITSNVKLDNSKINIAMNNYSAESNPIIIVGQNESNTILSIESTINNTESSTLVPQRFALLSVHESQTNTNTIVISDHTPESTNKALVPAYKAHIVSRNGNKVQPSVTTNKPTQTPESKIKHDPLDILNDAIATKTTQNKPSANTNNQIYIQLAAASHKNNVISLQNSLNSKGTHTFIQEISTPKGTMYRLRVGPFANRSDAEHKLTDLKNQGQTAIITSN